ncbi:8-oxoguanine glycosylase ogg1 [Kickxella alabastrina]|uniref:8-oxoguanine glycosylase ogg1 n=1 Tax=Kickxella alabastrina TaxID=61397 RepID=A0ACC1IIQ8_9FUNG|nr:8-oxoguanine glycosylase ogg1 [Kickxella alabastrina]
MPAWTDLKIKPSELRLDPTLTCGQAFRWQSTGPSEWTCALFGHAIDLKQTPTTILFRTLGHLKTAPTDHSHVESSLRDYLQLHISLETLCDTWTIVDPDFAKLRKAQEGVRTLRQPVVETLFAFIASSNNNIKRITMLVNKFCAYFGTPIETNKGIFYTFPEVKDIAQCVDIEGTLKELGFGYRAKYYAKTVALLCDSHECPEIFLLGLRDKSLEEARKALLQLSGVGPKVADCVCLMALDKPGAVPVDTHIWQVALRRYVPRIANVQDGIGAEQSRRLVLPEDKVELVRGLAKLLVAGQKAPSTKAYEAAQQLIIALFGPFAGWAQGMLFSGDLDTTESAAAAVKKEPAASKRKAKVDVSPVKPAKPIKPENPTKPEIPASSIKMRLRK